MDNIKSFEVHWSVDGVKTFAPLFRTYRGLNLTEEDVKEHHIKVVLWEMNNDFREHNYVVVPKHINIHHIKDITDEEV